MSAPSAILSTLVRIQNAVDHQDRDKFADCWTEDTRLWIKMFDGEVREFNGRDDLVRRVTATWTGAHSEMRHLVGAAEVAMRNATEASAQFYCTYFAVGASCHVVGLGEYHDLLVSGHDGLWRVKDRKHWFLTPMNLRPM